jgi:L-lactate dehydrogenase
MDYFRPKVAVIGGGSVGMRYIYALMIRGVARQIVVIDPDKKKIEGEVMDLSHGAPYISPVEVITGDYPDIAGADLIVITAGRKQKPGQSRIDLVRDNVVLYKKIIPDVMKYAPKAILLVVSNPVDILAYAAYKISGKPSREIVGSGTVLDSARFRFEIARHCHVDPRSIHGYILGEHGDTEFPVWSKVMIGGVLMEEYCLICHMRAQCTHQQALQDLFVSVRDSASQIIERKGETSYGIGLALVRITQAILDDENSVLPVSSLVEDYLGERDLYLSLPAIVNRGGVREVLNISLNDQEQKAFKHSADTIRAIIKESGL